MDDRREQQRVRTLFELLYSAGREEGHGLLADISYAGARISDTELRPEVGTQVRLYVFIQPVCPLEIVGEVTRLTEDGFVVEYEIVDPDVKQLIDEAAGIVRTSDV